MSNSVGPADGVSAQRKQRNLFLWDVFIVAVLVAADLIAHGHFTWFGILLISIQSARVLWSWRRWRLGR